MTRSNPIAELKRLGQSVWLDQLDRTMIQSGQLAGYRDARGTGGAAHPAVFAVERYVKVVEAFLSGLEQLRERGGDLPGVHSVASFFVSRVDTKVDRLLEGRPELGRLRGKAGIANSKLAYEMFSQLHSGAR